MGQTTEACGRCHGTGGSSLGPCPACNGTGKAGLFSGDWIKWIKIGGWIMLALFVLGLVPQILIAKHGG